MLIWLKFHTIAKTYEMDKLWNCQGQKSLISQPSDLVATSMKYVDERADDQWEYL